MWEFIQANGVWILLGVFLLLMLRMHAGGAGCGMGHGSHGNDEEPTNARRRLPSDDATAAEASTATERLATRSRAGGCH